MSFTELLPENGHSGWPKHIGGYAVYKYNKRTYLFMHLLVVFRITNHQCMVTNQKIQNYNFACRFMWVFYWSPRLREEHRPRVFENRILRKVLGTKRDKVTEDWRRLHNEELRGLYTSSNVACSGDQIKKNKMRAVCGTFGGGERCIWGFVGKPQGKRPLCRN